MGVTLDEDQQAILDSVQFNSRTSVRSGNARGKDYVAAVASTCWINLYKKSKVVCTAPTDRQVVSIMMAEIATIYANAKDKRFIGGTVLTKDIKFRKKERYLIAFKAQDKRVEAWTGFHSPNLLVVVTEASGLEQVTFDSIESILTGGNSRLLIVFNPNNMAGEAYNSVKSKRYHAFKLNCLNAPNVLAKKTIYPGQVDYDWVKDKVENWCVPISSDAAVPDEYDFEFEQQWYRPNDLFLVKVMGEFPREGDDQLIPLSWVEAANERWKEWEQSKPDHKEYLRLGADIAGMGTNLTVLCHRYGNIVEKFEQFQKSGHMATAGKIKNRLIDSNFMVFVDTIGEGAGVHSRLQELKQNSVSAKFSLQTKRRDLTGQRRFLNMRAYCYWAVRDALDPQHKINLALPPIPELIEDLTEPKFKVDSQGRIRLELKEDIVKRLGRSPDYGDSLALTYYPQFGLSYQAETTER